MRVINVISSALVRIKLKLGYHVVLTNHLEKLASVVGCSDGMGSSRTRDVPVLGKF